MLNIVIPMAGAGSRFTKAGYKDPKPLIKVHGTPMIEAVVQNLRPSGPHRFVFIVQAAHAQAYGLRDFLPRISGGGDIIEIDGLTEGAACTVLKARHLIDNAQALMIANSDQYIDCRIDDYLDVMSEQELDGLIMTMTANDPKWSFVALDAHRHVTRVVEKEVISDEATVGIYNFRHGQDFVQAALDMIERDERVNGEFYVAPAYNTLIRRGHRVGIHNIGREADGMYGLGIPSDLELFLSLPLSERFKRG
ncbi:glycosyl transferase family 2 [Aquabacterium soli]|uniref:Glycosyl transferase family 2 n=1 Tax=Aquabacterium soli TaxID=2493092 RepID=A0A3R8TC23_9BURK|nr:glycosyltransferase family 2 protein [Aquabacterium soli]RRS04367.1 glycosyl transferase family 2 [Aquabacterium soli]